MSFPRSAASQLSSGWEPHGSSQTGSGLGWRSKAPAATRRAGPPPPLPATYAANWARLRPSQQLQDPSASQGNASQRPSSSADAAIEATRQFQSLERENRIASALENLTAQAQTSRASVDALAAALRGHGEDAKKRAQQLEEEFSKVRRTILAGDVRPTLVKENENTVATIKQFIEGIAAAQKLAIEKGFNRLSEEVSQGKRDFSRVEEKFRRLEERQTATERCLASLEKTLGALLDRASFAQDSRERHLESEENHQPTNRRKRDRSDKKKNKAKYKKLRKSESLDDPDYSPSAEKVRRRGRVVRVHSSSDSEKMTLDVSERKIYKSKRKSSLKPLSGNKSMAIRTRQRESERPVRCPSCSESSLRDFQGQMLPPCDQGVYSSCMLEDDCLFNDDNVATNGSVSSSESTRAVESSDAPWNWRTGVNDLKVAVVPKIPSIPCILRLKSYDREDASSQPAKKKKKRRS